MKNAFVTVGATALLTIAAANAAQAVVYQYSDASGMGNGAAFDSLVTTYDTDSGVLTWTTENLRRNGELMDGFWLVTNNGPSNPKGDDGLAIFYADFDANSLWAFEYNGQNNPYSYSAGEYLGDYSPGLFQAGDIQGFSLDVTSVYDQLSTDAPYDDQIGIWFHATFGTETQADPNGVLESWSYNAQSWYDRSGRPTIEVEPDPDPNNPVPAPATLPMVLLALLGLRKSLMAR